MQNNCGIEKGDTVRVLRGATSEEEKRYNAIWITSTRYTGKEYVVELVWEDAVVIGGVRFPFFVLEKIKSAKPTTTRDKVLSLLNDSDLGCAKGNIIEAVKLIMDEVEGAEE